MSIISPYVCNCDTVWQQWTGMYIYYWQSNCENSCEVHTWKLQSCFCLRNFMHSTANVRLNYFINFHNPIKYWPRDQRVKAAAKTRSGTPIVPNNSECWLANSGILDASNAVREAICVAVFHLPSQLTATAEWASGPREAAHSRRADIAISRPMIAVTQRNKTSRCHIP